MDPSALKSDFAFSNESFDDSDFSNLNLIGYRFHGCTFRGVRFDGSDLSYTRFTDCDLYTASFVESCLYATWLEDCNLTKVNFRGALLLGVRFFDVDITKTEFDPVPRVGMQRKPIPAGDRPEIQVLPGGEPLRVEPSSPAVSSVVLERESHGIGRDGFDRKIAFLEDPVGEPWHQHSRVAETARYLRKIHAENGYADEADRYHVVERQFARQAKSKTRVSRLRASVEWLFQDLLWSYGTSIAKPLAALGLLSCLFALVMVASASLTGSSGLREDSGRLLGSPLSWTDPFNAVYFLLTSPVGGGGFEPVGMGKLVFLAFGLAAVVLLALIFEVAIRRLGRD